MTIRFDAFDHYWLVGGHEGKVYSSKRAAFVQYDDEQYVAWLSQPTNEVTSTETVDELYSILRSNNVPPYHHVAKSVVLSRLTDTQLEAAIGGMTVRQQERWRAPDSPYVYADDEEVISNIAAVGADPSVVLAPE